MFTLLKDNFLSTLKIKFVKDVATLQVGNLVSTGLTFVASVVFARSLGPGNYGQYGLIFALVGLLHIFMNLGADYATTTLLAEAWAKKDRQEIKNLIIFYLKLSLLVMVSFGLLAFVIAPYLASRFYQNENIGQLARFVLLAGMLNVLFSLLTIILQAARKIKHLTILENINKIAYIIIPVGLVLFGLGLYGLVLGHLFSAILFFVFTVYFYYLLLKRTRMLPGFKEIFAGFKNVSLKKYFKFGFLIAIDKNLANLYSTLPLLFLGMFVSNQEVGYFKIAFGYLGLSLIFLKPISRLLAVQLPKSKTYGLPQLKKHFFQTAIYSCLMMAVVVAPMLIFGKFLVQIFYGTNYIPAVKLIYILWPYVVFSGLGVGLGALFRTLNKMYVAITSNFIILAVSIPIVYLLLKNYGLTGMIITIIGWTFIPILVLFIYFYYYFKKSNVTSHPYQPTID